MILVSHRLIRQKLDISCNQEKNKAQSPLFRRTFCVRDLKVKALARDQSGFHRSYVAQAGLSNLALVSPLVIGLTELYLWSP